MGAYCLFVCLFVLNFCAAIVTMLREGWKVSILRAHISVEWNNSLVKPSADVLVCSKDEFLCVGNATIEKNLFGGGTSTEYRIWPV